MIDDISSIAILTVAGISAESGLAMFRGPDGPLEGHHVEDHGQSHCDDLCKRPLADIIPPPAGGRGLGVGLRNGALTHPAATKFPRLKAGVIKSRCPLPQAGGEEKADLPLLPLPSPQRKLGSQEMA
ncbi:hypothetical protein BF95_15605 [Sphingobium sp. Ant17]|nr:hypothetical protein BF95_15605 [Sphingobium sp. Ant17]